MAVESAERTVLVDMDGVLANFDVQLLSQLATDHPDIEPVLERPNFYIAKDYPDPEQQKIIKEIYASRGFFARLPLIEDAVAGLTRIVELGYEPRICSSPVTKNPACSQEKLAWLSQHLVPHFGQKIVESAIITGDKHLFGGIALIDDQPHIRSSETAAWRHVVFD